MRSRSPRRRRLASGLRPSPRCGPALPCCRWKHPTARAPSRNCHPILADGGVNIEDLQIVHSPEGGRRDRALTVAAATADDATEVLTGAGLDPSGSRGPSMKIGCDLDAHSRAVRGSRGQVDAHRWRIAGGDRSRGAARQGLRALRYPFHRVLSRPARSGGSTCTRAMAWAPLMNATVPRGTRMPRPSTSHARPSR